MTINQLTTPRTAAALALAATLTVGLTACASSMSPAPASTAGSSSVPTATNAPTASNGTVAPVAAVPAPSPAVTADAYSQIVAGKLYQGTAAAPVRIGTDVPGQAPAGEAAFLAAGQTGSMDRAAASGKYLVIVFRSTTGKWAWKAFGTGVAGYFDEVASNGYREQIYLPTKAAALGGPFKVEGRVLDRAEYYLWVNN